MSEQAAIELQLLRQKNSVLERNLNQCLSGNIDLQTRLEVLAAKFDEMAKELEETKKLLDESKKSKKK